jgi:uncharacterized membrane protein YgaE (UPF0421/DUF939 family)
MAEPSRVTALQMSVRAALAAGLAVTLSPLLRFQFPVHALVTAVLVTDLDARKTRTAGLSRTVGTLLGASLGATISTLFGPHVMEVGPGVLLAMLLTYLLRLPNAAKVAGYVCAIVLLNFAEDPWWYAAHRVAETALGIAAAVLVSFLPKLLGRDWPALRPSRARKDGSR